MEVIGERLEMLRRGCKKRSSVDSQWTLSGQIGETDTAPMKQLKQYEHALNRCVCE